MTITLSDNTPHAVGTPNTATSDLKINEKTATPSLAFGSFLSEMFQAQSQETASPPCALGEALPNTEGQQIADPTALDLSWSLTPESTPLKEVNLGPHLNVITPETSVSDPQSLEAFARAQGLDESAVSWLFGAGSPASPSATNSANLGTGLSAPGLTASGINASGPMPGMPPVETPQTSAQATNPGLLGGVMAGLQSLWAMADGTEGKQAATSASGDALTEDGVPLNLMRMPTPAAVWMQRGSFNGLPADTATTPKAQAVSVTELDLGAQWGDDGLSQLLGTEGGGTSGATSTGTHGTAYANFAARWDASAAQRSELANANHTAATQSPDTATRSENIQNLADKMGQAVGQRILSEMEKGQWHLKLMLRPATLGHIEVEMRMRSGEFDAVFTAPNATTRDLLQDGMGKLKDTLSQMGMDVANIHVGDGQTSSSGGDSTPGSPKGKTASTQPLAPTAMSPENTRPAIVKTRNDGLDVLV